MTSTGQPLPIAVTESGELKVFGGGGSAVCTLADPLITEATLTAPGSTPTRSMEGYRMLTYQIDVIGNIDSTGTTQSLTARIEGNLIGNSFDNLSLDGNDLTITGNGTFLFSFTGLINNVRFTLVSINSSPIITVHLLRGR